MPDDVEPETEFKLAIFDASGARTEGEYFV